MTEIIPQPFDSCQSRGDIINHPIAQKHCPSDTNRKRTERIYERSLQQCVITGIFRWYVRRQGSALWKPEGEIFRLEESIPSQETLKKQIAENIRTCIIIRFEDLKEKSSLQTTSSDNGRLFLEGLSFGIGTCINMLKDDLLSLKSSDKF